MLHHIQCTSHDIRGTSTVAAVPGDVGPLSSLHVTDRGAGGERVQ